MNDFYKNLGSRFMFTNVVEQADWEAVDLTVKLWQERFLPRAKKTAGPASNRQLVEIKPIWKDGEVWKGDTRTAETKKMLEELSIKHLSGKNLTDVVIEIALENEWKERAYNYYYVSKLDPGHPVTASIHPRWKNRNAPYSNTIEVTFSIWANEFSDLDRKTTFRRPKPDPNANESQKLYRARDNLQNVRENGSLLAKSLLKLIP